MVLKLGGYSKMFIHYFINYPLKMIGCNENIYFSG